MPPWPLAPSSVFVSALHEEQIEPLRRALIHAVSDRRAMLEVRVPLTDGALLAEIHRAGEVLHQVSESIASAHSAESRISYVHRDSLDFADAPHPARRDLHRISTWLLEQWSGANAKLLQPGP